jgi:rod shape-determining protein MreD
MPLSPISAPRSKFDQILSWLITLLSVLLCTLALHTRFPGMTLMGLGPNWLLIWLVAWSLKRPVLIAAIAGVAVGFLQDAVTIPSQVASLAPSLAPTHAIGMGLAGGLTAMLQKQRYMQEDFISVALIVFGMAVISETAMAIQLALIVKNFATVWTLQQRVALGSAILSSLWSPVLHFPMSRYWRSLDIN